jgi:hypothetical protein
MNQNNHIAKFSNIDDVIQQFLNEITPDFKSGYKLVRKHDKLTKLSEDVYWIEFNEEGRFKAKHTEPAIGRSLILSPFNPSFTWQTTLVTEILKHTDKYTQFKTENSEYELFKF